MVSSDRPRIRVKMRDEIEKFRKENGNDSFTQKEMITYLVTRVDTIFDKLDKGAGKIAENRAGIKGMQKMMVVGVPLLISALVYIFLTALGIV